MEIYRKIASGVADSLSITNPIEIFKSTIDIPADAIVGDSFNLMSAATFTVNNSKGVTARAYAAIFNGPVWFKQGIQIDYDFIQGSVIFAGPSGVLSENNSYFYWDNSNKRLGLGNKTPAYTIDVAGTGNFSSKVLAGDSIVSSKGIFAGDSIRASKSITAIGRIRAGDSIFSFRSIKAGDSIVSLKSMHALSKIIAGDSIFSFRSIKAGDSIVSNKTVYGAAGVIGALYGG